MNLNKYLISNYNFMLEILVLQLELEDCPQKPKVGIIHSIYVNIETLNRITFN